MALATHSPSVGLMRRVAEQRGWQPANALLALTLYVFMKETKPSENYLTQYLVDIKGFSHDEVDNDIYTWWTYASACLALMVPVAFAWEPKRTARRRSLGLYKACVVAEVSAYAGTRALLLFGSSLFHMQLMQVLYALAGTLELAYFAYAWAIVAAAPHPPAQELRIQPVGVNVGAGNGSEGGSLYTGLLVADGGDDGARSRAEPMRGCSRARLGALLAGPTGYVVATGAVKASSVVGKLVGASIAQVDVIAHPPLGHLEAMNIVSAMCVAVAAAVALALPTLVGDNTAGGAGGAGHVDEHGDYTVAAGAKPTGVEVAGAASVARVAVSGDTATSGRGENVAQCLTAPAQGARVLLVFARNKVALAWALMWATVTTALLQAENYNQPLWLEDSAEVGISRWNGAIGVAAMAVAFVGSLAPSLLGGAAKGSGVSAAAARQSVDDTATRWALLATAAGGGVLVAMGLFKALWVGYGGYAAFQGAAALSLTVSRARIAERADALTGGRFGLVAATNAAIGYVLAAVSQALLSAANVGVGGEFAAYGVLVMVAAAGGAAVLWASQRASRVVTVC